MEREGTLEEQEQEIIYEEPTRTSEFIASAYNALNSVAEMDTALMTNTDKDRVKRIRRKSLRIIDHCLSLLYDELFDEEEE